MWDRAGIIVATRTEAGDTLIHGLSVGDKGRGPKQYQQAAPSVCDRCKHPVTMLDGTEARAHRNHPSVKRWRIVCVECREELRVISER